MSEYVYNDQNVYWEISYPMKLQRKKMDIMVIMDIIQLAPYFLHEPLALLILFYKNPRAA